MHQGPYREVEQRKQSEQEESDALQHQPRPRKHAPVGKENEDHGGGDQQNARQVVGKGETDQKGREQQVSAVAAVSPKEQEEDDQRNEESLEGVELGDHSPAPESPGEPESQCPDRRCDGSSAKMQSRQVHGEHC